MYAFRLLTKKALSGLRARLLGPHAEAVIYRSGEEMFALPSRDFTIGRRLGFSGTYEAEEHDRLKQLIETYDVRSIAFIGGHVGYFAVKLAPLVDEIFVVEPNPETFKFLELNIQLNGASNIKTFPVAATSRDCELEFWPAGENTGGSKVALSNGSYYTTYDRLNPIKVRGVSVDELNIRADLILLDVEGHEVEALKGMTQTLKSSRILACELIPSLLQEAGKDISQQVDLIGAHYDTFYIDSCDGAPMSKADILAYFNALHGDARRISRNVYCIQSNRDKLL